MGRTSSSNNVEQFVCVFDTIDTIVSYTIVIINLV